MLLNVDRLGSVLTRLLASSPLPSEGGAKVSFPKNVRVYVGHNVPGREHPHASHFVSSTIGKAMVSCGIAGATILPAIGVWRGANETTTVVEVVCGTQGELDSVKRLATLLRSVLAQDAVLMVSTPAQVELIGA